MSTGPNLVAAYDELHELKQAITSSFDVIVKQRNIISIFDGNTIETWEALQKEQEAIENEIKKEIKENGAEYSETAHFVIQKTKTYEYDPEKLRELVPDEAAFFIVSKESVKKADLDKAIKNKLVPEIAKEALREKSTSISFLDKAKIAEREEKTISV